MAYARCYTKMYLVVRIAVVLRTYVANRVDLLSKKGLNV